MLRGELEANDQLPIRMAEDWKVIERHPWKIAGADISILAKAYYERPNQEKLDQTQSGSKAGLFHGGSNKSPVGLAPTNL